MVDGVRDPASGAGRATLHAPEGMVCSVDHLASAAGLAMLRSGGTAADAGVAASAVLAVTTQHMCGMGGDLFAVVHPGEGGEPVALDASGRAGSGADPDRLRAEGHRHMPFRGDVRSATVPGCVDGWLALHQRFGRLPLSDVLAPAVSYADDSFPVSPTLAASVAAVAGVAGSDDLTVRPLRPGDPVRRPGVAKALRAVVGDGRAGFYGGEFGAGLIALGAGEYTEADLAEPLARWMPAVATPAWDHTLWTAPPPSQGYLTLAGAWLAERLPLPDDPDDPAWPHLLVEAARAAGHDRPAVLHDGADGPALVAPSRLEPRLAGIDPDRAAGGPGTSGAGGTIALTAVDGDRMAVSMLQSNAAGFGAHLVVPGTGIFLHNRGIGFSLEPGHPARYGPGRRPPHTLSPLLVTGSGGRLRAVLATMGGDTQPQILLQLLARLLGAGQAPGRAVAEGRWGLASPGEDRFHTWEQAELVVELEAHAAASWDDGLQRLGHHVTRLRRGAPLGHAHVISADAGGARMLAGAADPRAVTGAAAGL